MQGTGRPCLREMSKIDDHGWKVTVHSLNHRRSSCAVLTTKIERSWAKRIRSLFFVEMFENKRSLIITPTFQTYDLWPFTFAICFWLYTFKIVHFRPAFFKLTYITSDWMSFRSHRSLCLNISGALSFNKPPLRGRIEMYHRRTGGNSQKQQTVHHKLLTKHKTWGHGINI